MVSDSIQTRSKAPNSFGIIIRILTFSSVHLNSSEQMDIFQIFFCCLLEIPFDILSNI